MTTKRERFCKDPDATLDYAIDWTQWLVDDQITNSTWEVPAGLTIENEVFTSTSTVVWLSGGEVGKTYTITNHITTNSTPNRIDDRSFVIYIAQR